MFKNNFLKKKIGQGLVEFCLIFCIVAIASGAIAATEGSFKDMMITLGNNIADNGVFEENEDGGVNLTMSLPTIKGIDDVWGIKKAPTETTKFGDITYNPDHITFLPDDDPTGTGGLYAPIAQFEVVAGSTYDQTIYYDLSYDPDGGDSSWLHRYWLLERLTKKETPATLTCDSHNTCVGASNNAVFDVQDSTNIETSSIHTNQFSFAKTNGISSSGGEIISDSSHPYYQYCLGTAEECLPKHYANGIYRIKLVVKDRDNKYSAVRSVQFEVKTKNDYKSYVELVVSSVSDYESEGNDDDKYVALVDHEFGLVKDLYGVEHVVIQNNMLRTSVSSSWKITTTSRICRYETVIDGITGKEKYRSTEPMKDSQGRDVCWVQTTEVDNMEGLGDAGFSSEEDDEGNIWTQEKLEKNKWKFYIYDKRSLYYKKLFGNKPEQENDVATSPTLDVDLRTETEYNSLSNNQGAEGVWAVKNYRADFTTMPRKTQSGVEDYNHNYDGGRNLCPSGQINGSYNVYLSNCAEGKTFMYDFDDHPNDNLLEYNIPYKFPATVELLGFNNDPASATNREPSTTEGTYMKDHTIYEKVSSDYYTTTCAGLNCALKWQANTGTVEDEELVLQIQSNYNYFYTHIGSIDKNHKIDGQYSVENLEEESYEAVYRDASPDYNDGSLMYQIRQNAKGTNKRKLWDRGTKTSPGEENNFDPEFTSVRLSLADNSSAGYNPGWNAYSNKPYSGDGHGCAECTEPNYNTDVKMRWTEVRNISIPANGSPTIPEEEFECSYGDYPYGTMTYYFDFPGYETTRNARTRQMNLVEHVAFDWIYEYSGNGRVLSTPQTHKVKRAHWHTMGRTNETILSGRYNDPYEKNTETDDKRYKTTNNPKRLFTVSDFENLPTGTIRDGVSDPEYWQILNGSISITLDAGGEQESHTDTRFREKENSCDYCSYTQRKDHWLEGTVSLNIRWFGMSEIIRDGNGSNNQGFYTERYKARNRSTGWQGKACKLACCSCDD